MPVNISELLELLRGYQGTQALTFAEYQRRAVKTAIYPGQGSIVGLMYCGLGLGESGEVQGKIKKIWRDDEGEIKDHHRMAIAKEIGDVLWYCANTAHELDICLGQNVAETNLVKLEGRKKRGTLTGSGDDR
jgi:NTP pyrophosphatase (non-canonical NTP hydrolase)